MDGRRIGPQGYAGALRESPRYERPLYYKGNRRSVVGDTAAVSIPDKVELEVECLGRLTGLAGFVFYQLAAGSNDKRRR